MDKFKDVSIRARVAYLICSFERLLLHYNCKKEEWRGVLEKLWTFTTVEYLDDWLYELAEYMPNSILEDTMEDAEYITEDEFNGLYDLYSKTNQEILLFMEIIFKCGKCELYTKIYDYSPDTLKMIEEGIRILNACKIDLVDVNAFEKYSFDESDGWGECFEGKEFSVFI